MVSLVIFFEKLVNNILKLNLYSGAAETVCSPETNESFDTSFWWCS